MGVLTGLLVPVAFRNKCERATGPKPEPFQSIFSGVNATRTSGTGLERDRNANRNRCEQGHMSKCALKNRMSMFCVVIGLLVVLFFPVTDTYTFVHSKPRGFYDTSVL